jgi:NADPH:quinone reductase-like Zn-dependent oxidoreductase
MPLNNHIINNKIYLCLFVGIKLVGVTNFKAGDEVYGMTGGIAGVPGTLAEYAAVDAQLIAKKPHNLDMRDSAAVPLIFITAWEGLVDRANVGPGKNVLIHGGAGGVGHVAVQIAVAKGANVFSTVSPAQNELIKSYGATPIDYTSLSVDGYVEQYTGGEGFDIIFDSVGGAVLDSSFKAAKQYFGHVISILGWGTHHLAPLSFKGATYSGVFTLYPLITGKGRAHHAEILQESTLLIEAGKLTPSVDPQSFKPDTIEEAYQYLESGSNQGKVVVDIVF